jgi:hypothetical protein
LAGPVEGSLTPAADAPSRPTIHNAFPHRTKDDKLISSLATHPAPRGANESYASPMQNHLLKDLGE